MPESRLTSSGNKTSWVTPDGASLTVDNAVAMPDIHRKLLGLETNIEILDKVVGELEKRLHPILDNAEMDMLKDLPSEPAACEISGTLRDYADRIKQITEVIKRITSKLEV